MKREGLKTYTDVQMYFTNRMCNLIESKGARVIGWNEILGFDVHGYDTNTDEGSGILKLPKSAIVQFWKGDQRLAKEACEQGHYVVNSTHWFTYLDYTYQSLTMRKAYSHEPVFEGLSAENEKYVLGFGTQMWTEWIPTIVKLHQQVFPRLLAYAEVGWTQRSLRNFDDFLHRLSPALLILDTLNIDYTKTDYQMLCWGDMYKEKQIGTWEGLAVEAEPFSVEITKELEDGKSDYDIIFLQTEGGWSRIENIAVYEDGKLIVKTDVPTECSTSINMQRNMEHRFTICKVKGRKYYLRATVRSLSGDKSVGNIYLRKSVNQSQ